MGIASAFLTQCTVTWVQSPQLYNGHSLASRYAYNTRDVMPMPCEFKPEFKSHSVDLVEKRSWMCCRDTDCS